jgi:TfoX/Sxy family transcriptional regulator of competence genes
VSTDPGVVSFIEDQLGGLSIRTAKMFGEYGIYCDEKIVGLICDDTLYLKPAGIDAGLLAGTDLAPPYPGAKPYHRVPGDRLDDRDWLQEAVRATADALPAPKAVKRPQGPSSGGGGF